MRQQSRLLSRNFLEANFSPVGSKRTKGDSLVYFPRQTIRLLVNLFATILLSIWRLNKHQSKGSPEEIVTLEYIFSCQTFPNNSRNYLFSNQKKIHLFICFPPFDYLSSLIGLVLRVLDSEILKRFFLFSGILLLA